MLFGRGGFGKMDFKFQIYNTAGKSANSMIRIEETDQKY